MANIPWARAPGYEAYRGAYAKPAVPSFLGGLFKGYQEERERRRRKLKEDRAFGEEQRQFEVTTKETKEHREKERAFKYERLLTDKELAEWNKKYKLEDQRIRKQSAKDTADRGKGYLTLAQKKQKDDEINEARERLVDGIVGDIVVKSKGKRDIIEKLTNYAKEKHKEYAGDISAGVSKRLPVERPGITRGKTDLTPTQRRNAEHIVREWNLLSDEDRKYEEENRGEDWLKYDRARRDLGLTGDTATGKPARYSELTPEEKIYYEQAIKDFPGIDKEATILGIINAREKKKI